jgi:hypothetical protein
VVVEVVLVGQLQGVLEVQVEVALVFLRQEVRVLLVRGTMVEMALALLPIMAVVVAVALVGLVVMAQAVVLVLVVVALRLLFQARR